MSERDKRLAEKYAAKGKKSASETSREKAARRSSRTAPAAGSVEDALRKFDPARPKETAIPRSPESIKRARASKGRLPRLG